MKLAILKFIVIIILIIISKRIWASDIELYPVGAIGIASLAAKV